MECPFFLVKFGEVKADYQKKQRKAKIGVHETRKSAKRFQYVKNGKISFTVKSAYETFDATKLLAYISRTEISKSNLPPSINGDVIGWVDVSFEYLTDCRSVICMVDMGTLIEKEGTHPVLSLNTNNIATANAFSLKVCYEKKDWLIGESKSFQLTSDKPRKDKKRLRLPLQLPATNHHMNNGKVPMNCGTWTAPFYENPMSQVNSNILEGMDVLPNGTLDDFVYDDHQAESCYSCGAAVTETLQDNVPLFPGDSEITIPCERPNGGALEPLLTCNPPVVRTHATTDEANQVDAEFDRITAKCIKTNHLRAIHMKVGKFISSGGDISYRIPAALNLTKDKYIEEGIVVALFQGEDGKPILERLTRENLKCAVLAGVITRSAYFESKLLADEEASDVIGVLGVVDVYIRGTVRYGEIVLADYKLPGVGISKTNWEKCRSMNSFNYESPHLIGTSVGTIKSDEDRNERKIKKVKCLISLPLTRTYREHSQQIETAKRDCEKQLNESKKRIYKRTCIGVFSATLFLILLGVMLHQFVARGTAFQYAICRTNAVSSVPVCLKFNSPLDGESIIVKGYEFKYEDLRKKLKLKTSTLEQRLNLHPKHQNIRYYLNVDRCAYMRPWFRNRKENKGILIRGIEVFATYHNNSRSTVFGIDDEQWDKFKRKVKYLSKCPDDNS